VGEWGERSARKHSKILPGGSLERSNVPS